MNKKIYTTKTHIEDCHNLSELDFILHDEFGFDYDKHDDFETIRKGEYGRADGFPVKIDSIINELQKLKDAGSTHVELEYHCDHIGYEISGYEIRLSTEEEICEFDKEYLKEKQKQEEITKLQKQIENIKKQ